jgi:hypothetical protein
MIVFAMAAFWNTWRTGHLLSGPLIMIPAAAISGMAGALVGKCAGMFHAPPKGHV